MASRQSSKSEKSVRLILIYVVKCTIFIHFFQTLNFDGLPFLGQLRLERVIHLKKSPITYCLKEVLKLDEFLQWRAPECMKTVHFTTLIRTCWTLFSDFELWRLTISTPIEIWKSYIPQKKALLPTVWKQVWNWKNLYHDRLHTSFSKSSAFSVKRAWPPSKWCHAQYLSWF